MLCLMLMKKMFTRTFTGARNTWTPHLLEKEWHNLLLEKRLRFNERFWVVSHHLLVNQ